MSDEQPISLSERTSVGLPLKNLIAIGLAISAGTYAFFGIEERLNQLDMRLTLTQASVDANSQFSEELQRGTVSTSASQDTLAAKLLCLRNCNQKLPLRVTRQRLMQNKMLSAFLFLHRDLTHLKQNTKGQ